MSNVDINNKPRQCRNTEF